MFDWTKTRPHLGDKGGARRGRREQRTPESADCQDLAARTEAAGPAVRGVGIEPALRRQDAGPRGRDPPFDDLVVREQRAPLAESIHRNTPPRGVEYTRG